MSAEKTAKPAPTGADTFIAAGHTEDDLKALPRESLGYTVEAAGDEFVFEWPNKVVIRVMQPHEERGGLFAEVSVAVKGQEIHWSRENLSLLANRERLVKKCGRLVSGIAWETIIEHACRQSARRLRDGRPFTELSPRLHPQQFLIEPILPRGHTSVLYADGGTGKGFVTVQLGLAVSHSVPLPGGLRVTEQGAVMYLDWEVEAPDQEDRLCRMLPPGVRFDPSRFIHRVMTRPLWEEAARIRQEIDRRRVIFLIVDSIVPSSGESPEGADAALRTLQALRTFGGVTRLGLSHVSAASAQNKNSLTRPYGSSQVWNQARSVIELRRSDDAARDELVVSLFHRKCNLARRADPIALRFLFRDADNRIDTTGTALDQHEDLAKLRPAPVRILAHLREHGDYLTTEQIAEALGIKPGTVRRTLRRLLDKGRV